MAKTPQEKALKTLRKLERQFDGIAETTVRQDLSYRLIEMRKVIWDNQARRAQRAAVARKCLCHKGDS